MTLGRCTKFSLSPIFAISRTFNEDAGFIFGCVYLLAISGSLRTKRKLNLREKFPIYGIDLKDPRIDNKTSSMTISNVSWRIIAREAYLKVAFMQLLPHLYFLITKFCTYTQIGWKQIILKGKKTPHIHFGCYLKQRRINCVNESLFKNV